MSRLLDDNPRACVQPPTTSGARDVPRACRIVLRGTVQGVGVRPAIARLARRLELAGHVSNSSGGVLIHVEGPASQLARFDACLAECLPAGTVTESVDVKDAQWLGAERFEIVSSDCEGPLRTHVPPDVGACRECLAEVHAADNRRHGYLFATCTACGPRYSLLESMPYDRARTGMVQFAMCARCRREYSDPPDRRFHSQTNSCAACGPSVWLGDQTRPVIARDHSALANAVTALRGGRIVALRGVGGYQLLVDATSAAAVGELRRRKQRFGKPLAVMVADQTMAASLANMDTAEQEALRWPANPIVVLSRRAGAPLAPSISGGLDTIGLMLPTTPLHDALARAVGQPLVATSGNLEGEPLAFRAAASEQELSGIADVWLHHDRPIVRPIDDSVARVIAGKRATVRLARGLAPLPLNVPARHRILALGGHQKAAVALANGAQAILGPHVGDLETEAARGRYFEHVAAMRQLYGQDPQLLVHDQHPDYFTAQWAAQQPVPSLAVQHHHAHIVAGMIEPGWLDRQVLGVAWDGTGYGPDGTIWGGEFLTATARDYRRVAHLRAFGLPGGEAAVREPWRTAVSVVCEALGPESAAALKFIDVPREAVAQLVCVARKPRLCPQTTSAGRLFDAVAALVLGTSHAQFEGQPAMLLEAACDPSADGEYALPLVAGAPGVLDWRPLIEGLLDDRRGGVSPGAIAMRFHRALATGIAAVAGCFPNLPIVLGGGCFGNRVLTELVAARLLARGRTVATPGAIPTNDGGLAAGQLAIAVARCEGENRPCV